MDRMMDASPPVIEEGEEVKFVDVLPFFPAKIEDGKIGRLQFRINKKTVVDIDRCFRIPSDAKIPAEFKLLRGQ